MKKAIRQLIFALTFLTIIPGPKNIKIAPEDTGKSTSFYPLVGALLGYMTFLISKIPSLSELTLAVFITVFLILITRGLHADGLIDTFDGFLSGRKNREEIIKIMRESNIGALGFIAAFSVYLVKTALIYELLTRNITHFLIYLPILSRSGVAFAGYIFSYPEGQKGLGSSFVESIGITQVVSSLLISGILVFNRAKPFTLVLIPAVLFFWLIWGWVSSKKIGGITGDTIGAGIELSELFSSIAILVLY